MAKDDIIQKIQKLLALGKCEGATEAESLAAMARARELMERHQIEEAEIADAEGREYLRPDQLDVTVVDVPRARIPVWRKVLLGGVSKLYHCTALIGYTWNSERRDMDHVMKIAGFPDDRMATAATYQFLVDVASMGAGRWHFRRDKDAYLKGFSFRVVMRIDGEIKRAIDARALETTALAKYDKEAMVARFLEQKGVQEGRCGRVSVPDTAAYRSGEAAGNAVNLGAADYRRRQLGAFGFRV